MNDKIKTREIFKDIKILNKTGNATDKMKNAYIRTKDETQQIQESENKSPSAYATESTTNGVENILYEMGHQVKKQTGKLFKKIKDAHNAKNNMYNASDFVKKQAKKQTELNILTTTNPAMQTSKQTASRIIRFAPEYEKTIKQSLKSTNKPFKKTLKGTIKKVPKTIKSAEKTTKATIKTSQQAVKAATKAAQTSLKASKLTLKSVRIAAKISVATAKVTIKVAISTIKGIIASAKSLVALIAAGGWIAVVIIIVICMFGFILSSGFGVFLTNEQSYSQGNSTSQVVSEIKNNKYFYKIEQNKIDYPHEIVLYISSK